MLGNAAGLRSDVIHAVGKSLGKPDEEKGVASVDTIGGTRSMEDSEMCQTKNEETLPIIGWERDERRTGYIEDEDGTKWTTWEMGESRPIYGTLSAAAKLDSRHTDSPGANCPVAVTDNEHSIEHAQLLT